MVGFSAGFSLPCWLSGCWVEASKMSPRGAESFLGAVPLPSLLLGLTVRRKKGEIAPTWGFSYSPATPTAAPLPHFQNGSSCPQSFRHHHKIQHPSCGLLLHLLRRVKLQPTRTYFINNNCTSGCFYYLGVTFANKTEKTALGWMDLIATHRFCNPSHAAHILMCSPRCLPSPWLLEVLRLNHVLGTTSQAVACMSPALPRLRGPCLVPAGDTAATAERFSTHTHKPCFPH